MRMAKAWKTSTLLTKAVYNAKTRKLLVLFVRGTGRLYDDVPMDVAYNLMQDVSPGQAYATRIKGAYSSEPIEEDSVLAALQNV